MTSAAVDPSSPSVLYISVAGWKGGVLRSADEGRSWVIAGSGLPSDSEVTQVIAAGSPTFVYAIVQTRVFRSEDGGVSWESASPGLPPVRRLFASAVSNSVVYATTDFTTFFRSSDAGRSWKSASSSGLFAVDPRDANRVYGATAQGFSVSEDGGTTWHLTSLPILARGPVTTAGVSSVAVDPRQGTVYASTYQCLHSRFATTCAEYVYRSTDQGSTFVEVRSQANPGEPGIVLGVDSTSTVYDGREISRDGGNTWTSAELLKISFFASSFSSPLVLAASSPFQVDAQGSLLSSTDQGRTWVALTVPGCINPVEPDSVVGLCLGGRFAASVTFPMPGLFSRGSPRKGTEDAGFFWALSENNIELAVKVVDGRTVNGKYWVFVAALTDLEYDLLVTDTLTGTIWKRHSPAGQLASVADTEAF